MAYYDTSMRWRNIVAFMLIIIVIAGCLNYNIYLHNQLTDTTERLETTIEERDALETNLSEVTEELEMITDELAKANEEIADQSVEIQTYINEIVKQHEEIESYKKYIEDDEAKWKCRYEAYTTATEVWMLMKSYGWSDIACAGIMGNLMAETGGTGSLYLDWDASGGNGYGLVQWIGNRRANITRRYGYRPTVEEQVQFIHDELYGVNGVSRQVSPGQLDAIMNAETPEDSAYAFACYYERCANNVRWMRRGFARKAYEYFVGQYY